MNRRVELTTEELLILDGKVSKQVQMEVDAAKKVLAVMERRPELTEGEAELIQGVISEASGMKLLRWRNVQLTKCGVCGRAAEYPPFKSGPRKGQPNTKRGLMKFGGIEMADRFVRISGYATLGGCIECMERLKPIIIEEIDGIPCEVSEGLSGEKQKWKRYGVRKCKKCGWVGHEGKMGMLPAMMGGKYPGECPVCGSRSMPFGPVVFESTGEYEVVEVGGS